METPRSPDEVMLELKQAAQGLYAIADRALGELGMHDYKGSILQQARKFNEEYLSDDYALLNWYKANTESKGDILVEAVYDLVGEYLAAKGLIIQHVELRKESELKPMNMVYSDPSNFYRRYKNREPGIYYPGDQNQRFFLLAMVEMIGRGQVSRIETMDLEFLMSQREFLNTLRASSPLCVEQVSRYLALSGFTEES